jgi:hypothetical protein
VEDRNTSGGAAYSIFQEAALSTTNDIIGQLAGGHFNNFGDALATLRMAVGEAYPNWTESQIQSFVRVLVLDEVKTTMFGVDNLIESIEKRSSEVFDNHCFKSDTPIQMWPLDPSIKPRLDGSYDEQLVVSKFWEKPISEINVGDVVVADDKGRLGPKRVTRTMQNQATHLLNFWNTGVTPGHAYYCADGKFKDQHVPLMDILRTDGGIMRADGTTIRAATNCEVGSMGDMMIHAAATMQRPDGTWSEPK